MMFDWQREEGIRQATVCWEGQQEEETQSALKFSYCWTPPRRTHARAHTRTSIYNLDFLESLLTYNYKRINFKHSPKKVTQSPSS